jgi:putative tryptophan/tyrosine transport system substrate-binding protein
VASHKAAYLPRPIFRGMAVLRASGLSGLQYIVQEKSAELVAPIPIHRAEDIEPALASLDPQLQAMYVPPNILVNTNRILINKLAQEQRLPTMHGFREYVVSGGLMSYGPNTANLFRRAAEYVDKILQGAKPIDLPVEQPTEFDLVVNLKVAKAIGLEFSPSLLARADEVIE